MIGETAMLHKTRIAKVVAWIGLLLISGCAGALGNMQATDSTERGLSYVAAAIVTHGVLAAIFNK